MGLPHRILLAVALAMPPLAAPVARAEEQPIYQFDGYAIGGYDAVAYFLFGKAMKGSPDHALMWRGATWLFISDDTMLTFEMDPQAYAPQFGGYCAYGVAEGGLSGGDPHLFTIFAGKLYLNHNQAVQSEWDRAPAAMAIEAQDNWPDVLGR